MNYAKNDIVTLEISDISEDGEGIGKIDGFAIFVKDTVIGDLVQAKIVKVKKNYAYARLEKVITPSAYRVEPECAYHRQCGGCQLQIYDYEKQLEWKENKIKNNLIRIGGFDESFVNRVAEPVIGMDYPFHYRNKAQYPVGYDRNGNLITGFFAGRTHSIISNTNCPLGAEENEVILRTILSYMEEYGVSAYDESTGTGLVRHILIRKGFAGGQLMVCPVINGEHLPHQDDLISRLVRIPHMTSICVSINTKRTNVIMGEEIRCLWGSPVIEDTIHVRDMKTEGYPFTGRALTFCISPLSFYQVNPVSTEKLYSLALEYAQLTGKETVWDLYCGIGTISLFMAEDAGSVYGVEVEEAAVKDARENAGRNGIKNVEFFAGKAQEVLPEKYYHDNIRADVIVVDPPRKGCDEACLSTMIRMSPEKIIYISCNPATLARDLRILCDGGYEIRKVRGVDQFPMTVHVETVVLLSRGERSDHYNLQ